MSRRLFAYVALSLVGPSLSYAQSTRTPEPGPLAVLSVPEIVLHDVERDKDLQLRVSYPAGDGPFPVVVWSHGAFGTKDDYWPLVDYWTSYGYVVVQPNHSDSRALGVRPGDPDGFRDWQSRPGDVSFVLDSLKELTKKEPALAGKLDAERVGVGGHSFGANTAQLVGGARAFPGGGPEKSFADARAKAFLLLSGQEPGEMLRESSWEKFTRPLFVMSGSADGPTRTGQPAAWRKQPYELSPPGDKWLVWVEGLDHGYGGVTGSNNPRLKSNAEHVKYTKLATLAFWDAYLKHDAAAKTYLQSPALKEYSFGAVTIEGK